MSVVGHMVRHPWLITEEWLFRLIDIAERKLGDVDLAALIREERAARPSAVIAQSGRPLDGARRITVRDGVAILEITGPIIRRADFFSDVSGATSIGALSLDFQQALLSPGVEAILLAVDSPGGEVTGVSEFAQQIYGARVSKPVWAHVEGLGASAAYWISSAADQVYAGDTALLGSIGVVMAVRDPSKAVGKDIEIVSSQSPKKRPDVLSEGGRAQLQTVVDDLAERFVATVAKQRGVTEAKVLAEFGQGDILIAQKAIDAGLADKIGTFEETLAALTAHVQERRMSPQSHGRRMSAVEENEMKLSEMWRGAFGGFLSAAKDQGIEIEADTVDTSTAVAAAQPATTSAEPTSPAAATSTAKQEPDPKVAALEAKAADQQKQLEAAQATIATMQAEQRTARLTALTKGWYGASADHLAVLTSLAAGEGGEEGAAFQAYVRTQNAAAELARQSKVFGALGTDQAPAGGSATERFMALVTAHQKENAKATYADAVSAVARDNSGLYEEYTAENTRKV